LCDLRHIVYRTADDRSDGAPPSVRNLLREGLLKENIDGEAVAWAAGRLRARPEARKVLVVVSDGVPVDDSTLSVNPGNYLDRHLRTVIASIREAGDVWLAGIGLDVDLSRYYPRALSTGPGNEPSQVVNFVADCTDVAVVPGPQPALAELDDEPPPPAAITVSATFLAMVAAFLGFAVITVALPDFQRFTTFPLVVVGWLISLCLHEFGHAVVAYGSGDVSVRDKGYLTLDPRHYVNFEFSILWPLLVLIMGGVGLPGGAVYVNTRLLSPSSRSLVSAAGPLATLAVLILLLYALHGVDPVGSGLYAPLAFLAFLQVTALVLNLLPLPGLDGWGIIAPWLPPAVRQAGIRWGQAAVALLFVSLFIDPVNRAFFRLVFRLCRMIGLDVAAAMDGFELFRFWNLLTTH
jgi:Zn-dependent protease